MRDAALKVANGLGGFVHDLGVKGFILCLLGLVLFVLAVSFLTATMQLVDAALDIWNKAPTTLRRVLVVFAAFGLAPTLMALIPWRSAFAAAVVAAIVVLVVGAAYYSHRYQTEFASPWAAWGYHFRMKATKPRLAKAIDNGTSKKGTKVLKLRRLTDGSHEGELLPPPGYSAAKLAEEINDGTLQSSVAAQLGIQVTKGMTAMPLDGGMVNIRIASEVQRPEPLDEEWLVA